MTFSAPSTAPASQEAPSPAVAAARLVGRLTEVSALHLQVDDTEEALRAARLIAPTLATAVRETLRDLEILRADLSWPDPVEAANADLDEIGALIAKEAATQFIDDTAAATAFPLRYTLGALERAMSQGESVRLLSEADAALNRLKRALRGLSPLFSEHFGLSCPQLSDEEVQAAVATRRAYGELRRRLADDGVPADPVALESLIRRAADLFEALLYGDQDKTMRIDDRVEMRGLVHRIRSWESAPRSFNSAEPTHLAQDVVGFVRLLNGINNRQELIEHDQRAAEEALSGLQRCPLDETPSATVLAAIRTLEGRDRVVDSLLFADPPAPSRAWLLPLHRLVADLGGRDAKVAPSS